MPRHPLSRKLLTRAATLARAAATALGGWAFLRAPVARADAPATSAPPSDWFQWRGPNRDGHSPDKGLLKEWPKGGPPLAWKANGIGGGFSGVSLGGGKIFTLGDQKDACYAYGLDENGGKILWSTKVGEPGGDHPGPRCTPTVDGDRIYVLGQNGDLLCLHASDGKPVWHKNMKEDLKGRDGHWAYAESPLVDGNRLVCTPGGKDGTVAALNKQTGEVLWRTKDWQDSAEYSSIVAAEIGGKKQYVQLTQKNVGGVDPETGKVLWLAERHGATAVVPTPIVHDDEVYVTSGYGVGCTAFKIVHSGDTFRPEQIYQNKVMINHHGGVILVDGYVYGYSDKGGWTCQDFKTGEMKWQEGKGAPGKGSIAYADGHLYLRQENGPGTIALIDATPAGYHETGRFDQPDRSKSNSWPHPVIAGGKLYIRDQNVLLCYDVKAK